MEVTGYKYNNEQEAIDARTACADYYGLPTAPDNDTIYFVDYNVANLDNPIFYYIEYYPGTEPILGQPKTFEVIIEA
jgi:hypothetical protein